MALINSVVLIGNLTRDGEIKYFANGNAMVKMSIAQNRRVKKGEQWIDEPQFFDVQFGGKGAEAVHKYLTKGKQIGIQGELRQDRWEQDGQSRSKVYIYAFDIQLLGGREGSQSGREPVQDTPREAMPGKFTTDGKGNGDSFEDNIPF